jgi:hypothetical protein
VTTPDGSSKTVEAADGKSTDNNGFHPIISYDLFRKRMRVVMIRVAVLALISLAAMVFCLVLFSK